MKYFAKTYLIFFFILIFTEFMYSQNSKDIYLPKNCIEIFTPHITHASNINGESGLSILYSYPGFFSLLGQTSIYYTSKSNDSYFISLGEVYLMMGTSNNIKYFDMYDSKFFLNLNVGTFGRDGYLGSIGFSYLKKLINKNRIELITDIFFHQGYNADIIPDKDYSQGILFFINYSNLITKNLNINFGIGISFIRYRYIYTANGSIFVSNKEYRYRYVSKKMEKYYIENNLGINPAWDNQIIIPFGITVSYHF